MSSDFFSTTLLKGVEDYLKEAKQVMGRPWRFVFGVGIHFFGGRARMIIFLTLKSVIMEMLFFIFG